jgi:hypothetical protein
VLALDQAARVPARHTEPAREEKVEARVGLALRDQDPKSLLHGSEDGRRARRPPAGSRFR